LRRGCEVEKKAERTAGKGRCRGTARRDRDNVVVKWKEIDAQQEIFALKSKQQFSTSADRHSEGNQFHRRSKRKFY